MNGKIRKMPLESLSMRDFESILQEVTKQLEEVQISHTKLQNIIDKNLQELMKLDEMM